ncbi:hypothetical protein [Kitasatospora sp. NPDC059571]|uniref:SCO2583/SCO2584 N-terminal domain-containing protein n=1 Tax=Kitasatospora sp. NPDC059571 TaxID=3346871 RepID=UPI0036D1E4BE
MPTLDDPAQPQGDPFDGLVLDEDFIRAAPVREQSGRARMLAARWKHNPPQSESWRAPADVPQIRRSRFGRRAKRVDSPGGGRRRQRWVTVLAVAVSAASVLFLLSLGWPDAGPRSSALPPVGPESVAPTAAPPGVAPDTPTAEHPWAGSPADAWPAGAEAITVPDAEAVGVFSRSEVAAQLSAVRTFLVLTSVDPRTLAGSTPQAALDLMDRKERERMEQDLAHPAKDSDPTVWLSRFDPRVAVPVTDTVKVQGRVTFEGDGERGVVVHTDYTYVYAVRPGPDAGRAPATPGGAGTARPVAWNDTADAPTVEREIVRRELDFRFYDPAKYHVQRGKLFVSHSLASFGNNVCGSYTGFLQPGFPQFRGSATPSGPATLDPYDHSKPLDRHEGCDALSRS